MNRFVTFTPNPAVDLSTSVDRLVPAHKLRCEAPQVHPGGGGINVARVLHRLGAEVLAVYPAGGPHGERLHALLAREGVPDWRIPIAGDTRESFTVHERPHREAGAQVEGGGQEYRFVLPGPTLSEAEWAAALEGLRQASVGAGWVVASGSLPPGVAADGFAQVARMARALGARMVVDSWGPALQAALSEGVWLVKPSLRELSELVGTELATPRERWAAARRLIDEGQAQWVAVSLGGEGAMLVSAEDCLLAQGLPVSVAGSVGAGDSFLAGLVWALAQDAPMDRALASAMAAGAASVMASGTAMGQVEAMAELTRQVKVARFSG